MAIRVGGDQAAFWGCGFFGAQDTLYDERGRHYFRDCFIQGSIDFIYGNGRSMYEVIAQFCSLVSLYPKMPFRKDVRAKENAIDLRGELVRS